MPSKTNRERVSRILSALFFGLPFSLVTLIVRYSPSSYSGANLPALLLDWGLPLAAATCFAGYFLFYSFLGIKHQRSFLISITGICGGLIAVSVLAGLSLHPDYFSAAFQYALIWPTALLYGLWTAPADEFTRNTLKSLGIAGLVITGFFVEWIMLMGYAIATRAEPRAMESLVYNVYNLMLALALFIISRGVEHKSRRSVHISASRVMVDGKDVSSLFNPGQSQLLLSLAKAPGRTLDCCQASALQASHLQDLRKVLELIEVGTILVPRMSDQVLATTWKLVAFENVHFKVEG